MKNFIYELKNSYWWNILDDYRKNHIEEVVAKSVEYNKKFNLNITENKVCKAAYLHDISKGLNKESEIKFIINHNIKLDKYEKNSRSLFHAPISAYIAEKDFNINDNDILNAVRFHTVARKKMSLLDKLIYFSDFIAPHRKIEIASKIEEEHEKGLDYSLIVIVNEKIKVFLKLNKVIHPGIIKFRNKLLKKINLPNFTN